MTVHALFQELQRQQVTLLPDGEVLRYRAPQGVLTEDLRQAIRQHKAALLTLLAQAPKEPPGLEAEYRRFRDFLTRWDERAALMASDGGLPRADAEWQAYLSLRGGAHAPSPPLPP